MSEQQQNFDSSRPDSTELFKPAPSGGGGVPLMAWGAAGVVVLVALAVLLLVGRKPAGTGNTIQPSAAYAEKLPLTQLAMSESTSLSGGKSTFIDGHIQNTGSSIVTGVTVQVLFRNDEAMPPQVQTVPLTLIRTHEPYVDTQMVGSAPLKPGDDREFRLIFETIPGNWNIQMPELHIVEAKTR